MLFEFLKFAFLTLSLSALAGIVLWVLVGMCSRRRDRPLRRWASERRAWIILYVIGFGLLCGVAGVYTAPSDSKTIQEQAWLGKLTDALYRGSLQLFLNGEVNPNDSVFTRIARLSGLAASVLLAYEAIQLLFAKPLQQYWLNRQKGHIVICGLGRVGKAIIADLTRTKSTNPSKEQDPQAKRARKSKRPDRLVVIERNKDNPDIPWAESRGVSVVIGNATDHEVLLSAGAERAKDVVFAIGADEQNLESVYDLMCIVSQQTIQASATQDRIIQNGVMQNTAPRMFVHLLNPRLESVLVQAKNRAFGVNSGQSQRGLEQIVVQPFNVLDRSIQALLDGPVLDRRPGKEESSRDIEVAHFVIVGFGEVGQELAVRIAQMAHYENLKRARMTIVYSKADEVAVENFRSLYPKFFPNLGSYESDLKLVGKDPKNYDPWMPFCELDDWGFGVSTKKKRVVSPTEPQKEIEVLVTAESRGIEFAINGGFVHSSGGVTSHEFVRRLEDLSRARGVRPLVFICHSEDDLNCADATELRSELDLRLKQAAGTNPPTYMDEREHRITIFPYVPNRPMLHRLIEPSNTPGADLIPWGDCREICVYDALTADLYRPLATAINHDFDFKYAQKHAKRMGTPETGRENIPVESLDSMIAWKRHSNLMAATHVNTKLAPLGLMLRPVGTDSPAINRDDVRISKIIQRSTYHDVRREWIAETDEDRLLETIAKMEHHRWVAERLLMDWSFGEKAVKGAPENKHRTSMVDWDNLLDTEWVKDRDQIARILELCCQESMRREADRRIELCVRK